MTTGYDALAAVYEDIYADWHEVVHWQGRFLSDLLAKNVGREKLRILDAACGIGTQAIGLAANGHVVHGIDPSERAVSRARDLAFSFRVDLTVSVGDLRRLDKIASGPFDGVIACDNALPHLLTEDDIVTACRSARSKLDAGGVFLATIRDWAKIEGQPAGTPLRVFGKKGSRRAVFQMWDWQDERTWIPELFILRESISGWTHESYVLPPYRGITVEHVADLMKAAGFWKVEMLMPEHGGFYQPILIAHTD